MHANLSAANDSACSAPLSVVWRRLASELEALGGAGIEIEHSFCRLLSERKAGDDVASEAQKVDHLLQHIEALRAFVDTMAHQLHDQGDVEMTEALQRITLSAVRARLGGFEGKREPDLRVEVELF